MDTLNLGHEQSLTLTITRYNIKSMFPEQQSVNKKVSGF